MKFKSIQFSIAVLAGASILAVVVALVLYALYSSAGTQNLVQVRTKALLEQVIEQRLASLARAQVGLIQRELEIPLQITADLARVNAMLGMTDENGGALLALSREELSNLVRETSEQNPKLLGTYIGWEANAFDASDDLYAGPKENGYDGSGRFIPWWYRNTEGKLAVDALGTLESEKLLPTGVREGEYYLCPKEGKRPCVIDPAPYDVGGKMIMLASFTTPILVKGEFRGIAGVDLAVNFIQELLNAADKQLYDGAGELALIASNGRLVAFTQDPSKLGEPASSVLKSAKVTSLAQLSSDQASYEVDQDRGLIELFLPFSIANTTARWTLMLQLPLDAVMGDLQSLQKDLSAQRDQEIFGMALVGLLVAGLGLLVIWFVGYGIARPLKQMVAMLDDIAQGEGDLTRRLATDRADELGAIAKGFNTFLGKLQVMISQVVTSV